MLREEIDRRNADKWKSVPSYIDYLECNFKEDLPFAVSIGIDGTVLQEKSRKIMPYCLNAFEEMTLKGVTIFIVTARSSNTRIETVNELRDEGVRPELYHELLMSDGTAAP